MPDKTTSASKLQPTESVPSRTWQACQPCRRRKVKCDGKQPCYNCSSRGQACEFPEAKDHASVSRYYASSFEARCQQMDAMCQKLEVITAQILRAVEVVENNSQTSLKVDGRLNEDLVKPTTVLHSLLQNDKLNTGRVADNNGRHSLQGQAMSACLDELSDSSDSDDNPDQGTSDGEDVADQAGAFVTDSYGRLRFVGGVVNKMLIDAAKGLSPTNRTGHTQPLESRIVTESADLKGGEIAQETRDVELPLFVRGKVWPELPFLPKPEQLSRPPQYISDVLIGLYFDKLHYTFPILFKPHFMRSYGKMLRNGLNVPSPPLDKDFLMVFFAVCACASGLLPTGPDRGFPGLEYYEKALLLHYSSPGQASLERVQCLGLLAMCTASWNTLTQSWSLAGLAVRSSMDIGLHVNSRFTMPTISKSRDIPPLGFLRNEIARRTWWSVFCLERTVSICLGRPMAVDDKDCCCELPLDISDEALERYCQDSSHDARVLHDQLTPLTGFLAFARLCQISVRIQQLGSPLRLRKLASLSLQKTRKYLSRVASLDQALRNWLETLPDSIRFSANAVDQRAGGDSRLVMCVIIFILHAGSLLNLFRYLARVPKRARKANTDKDMKEATTQCVSAARSCINAAELVRDLVPPSHYLAICVHCLTLSGVALLCMSKRPADYQTRVDVEMCINLLKDLEARWSGASRSRAIIENLLEESCRKRNDYGTNEPTDATHHERPSGTKRLHSEFESNIHTSLEDSIWRDIPWPDLLDGNEGQLGQWGPYEWGGMW